MHGDLRNGLLIGVTLALGIGLGVGIGWQIRAEAATPLSRDNGENPTPTPAMPAHEIRVAEYTAEERAYLDSHTEAALQGVEHADDPIIAALALNAYVFDHFTRVPHAGGVSGVDLLRRGEAICGGMAITLAEMLHTSGIRSTLAYLVGGGVAHSLVEAFLPDNRRLLLDPYHGVAYLDHSTSNRRPLSLNQVRSAVEAGRTDIAIVYQGNEVHKDIFESYVALGEQDRAMPLYDLEAFTHAHGYGLAHGGYVHRVLLDLQPGTTLGSTNWTPDNEWPRPWTELAVLQDSDGEYLSWAYQLGESRSLGYRIRHTYRCRNLVPGRRYEIRMHIAAAYQVADICSIPMLNFHRADDRASGTHIEIGIVNPNLEDYSPHVVRYQFEAQDAVELHLAELSGIATVSAIALHEIVDDRDDR